MAFAARLQGDGSAAAFKCLICQDSGLWAKVWITLLTSHMLESALRNDDPGQPSYKCNRWLKKSL
jgi:hypothetical protein